MARCLGIGSSYVGTVNGAGFKEVSFNSWLHVLFATVPGMCFGCCASISTLPHQDHAAGCTCVKALWLQQNDHMQQYLCHSTCCNAPFPATTSLPAIHPSPTTPPHPTPTLSAR